MEACDWNLKQVCGSDILQLLIESQKDLQGSDELIATVNKLAVLQIFDMADCR